MKSELYGPSGFDIYAQNSLTISEDMFADQGEIKKCLNAETHKEFVSHLKKINCDCCSIGKACPPNKDYKKTPVIFDGNPKAAILFVGEAPGKDEWVSGKPFMGKSGQLLREIILQYDFKPKHFAFANITMCRPFDLIDDRNQDRPPSSDEAKTCMGYLLKQIYLIKPYVIVPLGKTASIYLMGLKTSAAISSVVGKPYIAKSMVFRRESNKPYHPYMFPNYHPAACLRGRDFTGENLATFKQTMAKLHKLYYFPQSFHIFDYDSSLFSSKSLLKSCVKGS